MADREQIEALVTQYVEAVGAQDLEATLACFAPDAVQEDPLGTPPNVGHEAIRRFFEKSYRAPFTVTREGDTRIGGDYASFRFTIEVPAKNGLVLVRVADLAQVGEDGRFSHMWAIQDVR